MPYQADAYKVMIASPSDVQSEREIIRDVIQNWNYVHSENEGLVLMPIGWETHSSPTMGASPQDIINRQVLKNCDLLIAVFWTRLGSPTGLSPSGTVEEIEEHLAKDRPAMIYFSAQPVRPDGLNQEQYQALVAFKKKCKSTGLVQEYETLADFKDKLTLHLALNVIRNFKVNLETKPGDIPDPSQRLATSLAARFLLIQAAQDSNGVIVLSQTFAGLHIRTNGRELVEQQTPREQAKWRGAIQELIGESWIEDRTGKGEVFFVTEEGYGIADWFLRNSDASATSSAETDARRKVRKILEMKGRSITFRQLAPENEVINVGRVRSENEVMVLDCNEDVVSLETTSGNTSNSFPLPRILLGYDDKRHRPALELMP